ncbi:MAG TPA: prepilin-type N-terminal cleavage/methylation domain-containing protein [Bdellovibrionota bacterium]|nr:prepilin-type N-terminal cleavage/methylation domain-containing protein [Bdellovibrionota bacterium]
MKDRGFTLIEVILASVILAILGTLTWGSIAATFQTQQTVSRHTEMQEVGTTTLTKIQEDLSQVFHVEAPRPLTFFRGEDNMDHDRILFSALSHLPSGPNAHESDEAEVEYVTESNTSSEGLYFLKRRESPFLDEKPEEGGDFIPLASNVAAFNIEYSDGTTFRPTWDIRSSDQLNKMPKLVRIYLRLRDETGREAVFETTVDIPLSENLSVQVQQPAAGAPGTTQPGTMPGQPGVRPTTTPGANPSGANPSNDFDSGEIR